MAASSATCVASTSSCPASPSTTWAIRAPVFVDPTNAIAAILLALYETVAEPLGDYLRVGSTRGTLAIVHGLRGDVDGGLRLLRPVVRLVEDAGTDVFVPGMARAMGLLQLWRDSGA